MANIKDIFDANALVMAVDKGEQDIVLRDHIDLTQFFQGQAARRRARSNTPILKLSRGTRSFRGECAEDVTEPLASKVAGLASFNRVPGQCLMYARGPVFAVITENVWIDNLVVVTGPTKIFRNVASTIFTLQEGTAFLTNTQFVGTFNVSGSSHAWMIRSISVEGTSTGAYLQNVLVQNATSYAAPVSLSAPSLLQDCEFEGTPKSSLPHSPSFSNSNRGASGPPSGVVFASETATVLIRNTTLTPRFSTYEVVAANSATPVFSDDPETLMATAVPRDALVQPRPLAAANRSLLEMGQQPWYLALREELLGEPQPPPLDRGPLTAPAPGATVTAAPPALGPPSGAGSDAAAGGSDTGGFSAGTFALIAVGVALVLAVLSACAAWKLRGRLSKSADISSSDRVSDSRTRSGTHVAMTDRRRAARKGHSSPRSMSTEGLGRSASTGQAHSAQVTSQHSCSGRSSPSSSSRQHSEGEELKGCQEGSCFIRSHGASHTTSSEDRQPAADPASGPPTHHFSLGGAIDETFPSVGNATSPQRSAQVSVAEDRDAPKLALAASASAAQCPSGFTVLGIGIDKRVHPGTACPSAATTMPTGTAGAACWQAQLTEPGRAPEEAEARGGMGAVLAAQHSADEATFTIKPSCKVQGTVTHQSMPDVPTNPPSQAMRSTLPDTANAFMAPHGKVGPNLEAEAAAAASVAGSRAVAARAQDILQAAGSNARTVAAELERFPTDRLFHGYTMPVDRSTSLCGGQGVVQFVMKGGDVYAMKVFSSSSAFREETRVYSNETLKPFLPRLFEEFQPSHLRADERALMERDDRCAVLARPCIVMEKGKSLPNFWRDACTAAGGFSAPAVYTALIEVAHCLMNLHTSGYVHRDIKPDNLLFLNEAGPQWKLIDCGLAAQIGMHLVPGFTLTYAAPEAVAAHREGRKLCVSPALDAWSLGIVAFDLLTTRRPHSQMSGHQSTVTAMILGENGQCLPWEVEDEARQREITLNLGQMRNAVLGLLRRDPEQRMSVSAFHEYLDKQVPMY